MKFKEILLCAAIGILAGAGGFTFYYAKGLSYFSSDPKACVNCHVMNDEYDSWQKSSHHYAAKCIDCHIPHTFPQKYMVKAQNGWNHSRAFTLQNFEEPIRIKPGNLNVLQQNCLHCHEGIVSEINRHDQYVKSGPRCTECHRSVGHMSLD